ncbi:MAG TPA: hypothetical protein VHQ90_03720 [Thermoanaerobaculia bacterium]|nr:hypothetical protein [Thermoanaerobaculia bacterium]
MDAPLAVRTARVLKAALALVPLALPLASAVPALAVTQGPYTLELLVDGRPLAELYGNRRNYVEAFPGREYSLRLTNNTARRVAIALSVDGLNSIDAKTTTAQAGSKWILGPYESIVLDGWQTSSALARRFYFTTEKGSYGAWLGKTDNLGVIAAVVFRERLPEIEQPMLFRERSAPAIPESRAEGGVPSGAPSPPVAVPAEPDRMDARADARLESKESAAQLSDEYAATGIGREVDHQVERVRFDAERSAAACLEIRYEYRPALVRLGLLPPVRPSDPLQRRERSRGFEPGFAPDPYRPDGRR